MAIKTYEEINDKLSRGSAVVLTAMEFKELAKSLSPAQLVHTVDVVTTATFAPMCSSGVILNFGHADPPIRMEEIALNGVPAYEGLAAVDAYLGATAEAPGDASYGGAHVIEALVRGEEVRLCARGKGTDCYPRTALETSITLDRINEAWFFNPRNGYQNYGAASNGSNRLLRTYMGLSGPGLRQRLLFHFRGAFAPAERPRLPDGGRGNPRLPLRRPWQRRRSGHPVLRQERDGEIGPARVRRPDPGADGGSQGGGP